MAHDDVLKEYVQSATSPNGDWHLNVPVGFSLEADAEITMGRQRKSMRCVSRLGHKTRRSSTPSRSPALNSSIVTDSYNLAITEDCGRAASSTAKLRG
ncbi:hypothetical protein [Halorussus lipolyticus]|uniref:hypothetical protein n=1 Tax=Halorussus lipolyticus TaxID=3034024 RepID=UPI0023E83ED1|nr:hypothetical protein [Halorussus sp. DT80]